MIKNRYLALAVFAIGLGITFGALAKEEIKHATVNSKMGYQSLSLGDPLSDNGAKVTISAERAEAVTSGGIIYHASSKRWIGKVIRLSALIDAATPGVKATIWVRASEGSGKPLKFASSASAGIFADGRHTVELRVPSDAASIAFGVVMRGSGKVTAEGLKLMEIDRLPLSSGASAKQVYEEALKIVLENAYWSRNLKENQRNFGLELSGDAGSGYQAEAAIRALLRGLQDSHSVYVDAEEANNYSKSGGNANSAEVRLINGTMGYLLVPSVYGSNPALAADFAVQVSKKLNDLKEEARCGWIVDIRKNSGGNMWPMVSALSIFFGNERLGGFKRSNGSIDWWSIHSPSVTVVPGASEAQEVKIAVLLGQGTSSSGEALAVALMGRKNTRSFGAPSDGRASANSRFQLADGSAIYLTTAIDVDRSGREVGERVFPDTRISDDVVSSSEIPGEALNWLSSSCAK
ncbi:S41 family peptidase [Xanthomonas arboricola]|uniref:S41 family peptidase n=1 Tax=Xanthomonas arboricola TaxID=56448 RepID=UPI002B2A44A3|nr:S41 family peptidase [Xanthomonas arboricola]